MFAVRNQEDSLSTVLLKELFKMYFYFTAAGVVLCGSRKKPPRTSSVVRIIWPMFLILNVNSALEGTL